MRSLSPTSGRIFFIQPEWTSIVDAAPRSLKPVGACCCMEGVKLKKKAFRLGCPRGQLKQLMCTELSKGLQRWWLLKLKLRCEEFSKTTEKDFRLSSRIF